MLATNRPKGRGRGLQVENLTTDALQLLNQLVELGGLAVDAIESAAKVADLGNEARIVGQNVANSIEFGAPWSVQAGVTNEVGRQVEKASHNADYIKNGREAFADFPGTFST